jgi:hypothetical protein
LSPTERDAIDDWTFLPSYMKMKIDPVSETLCLKTLTKLGNVEEHSHFDYNTPLSDIFTLSEKEHFNPLEFLLVIFYWTASVVY